MENSTKEKEKEKWYPGKYLARHSSKRRSGEVPSRISSDNSDQRKTTSSVFPMENQEFVQEPVVGEVHLGSSPIGINSIGSVKVGVVELKYLRINSAKLTIQLDRALSQYAIDSSAKYFERIFELFEISTDVRIMVTGKGDNGELVCGVAVIPVASLLTFTGKPAPAKEQWRLLYPICVSRIADSKSFKFTAGYSDLAGYALNRCKDPLGFICVKVDLALTGNILSTYLAKGSIGWRKALTSAPWVDCESTNEALGSIHSNSELCAMINRDLARIWAVFRLPLTLSAVLSLPEVLVANLLMGCMCFVLDTWQLPLTLVGFFALNGAIAMSQRSYASVTVWNDPLPLTLVGTPADPNHSSNLPQSMDPLLFLAGSVPSSVTAYPAAAAAATALMQQQQADTDAELVPAGGGSQRGSSGGSSASGEADGGGAGRDKSSPSTAVRLLLQQNVALTRVARNLAQAAHFAEVIFNIFSFADGRASLIAYGVLFAVAVVISCGLVIWPRMVSFAVLTTTTMACAGGAFVLDLVGAKASNRGALGSEHMEKVSEGLDRLVAFMGRVPDELEMIHRHIAASAVINPKGSEMQDAAVAFEKRIVR